MLTKSFEEARLDFPLLSIKNRNKALVYLDNAATTQKPSSVLEAMQDYYVNDNANVHRGIYELAERATQSYENVRIQLQHFINATYSHEIIFTKGTTEAINLVASCFGAIAIKENDEIIISELEHHSNIVPWQLLCEQKAAHLKVARVQEDGTLDFEHFLSLINERTKLIAISHASNVLGTINPVEKIIEAAHQQAIPVLLDGAQASAHLPIDVQALDCDFYVFSAHKMYGPTGVGVLYAKTEFLEKMPPYQSGGDMILEVSFAKTRFNALPYKFEAGTPNMAGVVGWGSALSYLQQWDFGLIQQHEQSLLDYATDALSSVKHLRIIGEAKPKLGVISFVMDNVHPHDIATILDLEGVAIRAGHHCAMPLIERFGLPATARASFALYNNKADVEALFLGLEKVNKLFA